MLNLRNLTHIAMAIVVKKLNKVVLFEGADTYKSEPNVNNEKLILFILRKNRNRLLKVFRRGGSRHFILFRTNFTC